MKMTKEPKLQADLEHEILKSHLDIVSRLLKPHHDENMAHGGMVDGEQDEMALNQGKNMPVYNSAEMSDDVFSYEPEKAPTLRKLMAKRFAMSK